MVDITNHQQKLNLDDNFMQMLSDIGEALLVSEGVGEGAASVVLVDDDYIRDLNYQYRSINEPTDVLSFPLQENNGVSLPGEESLLGEIYISMERAQVQARELGHTLEREAAFLLSHGLLHLLGYTHDDDSEEQLMRGKQEKLLLHFGLGRENDA